MTKTRSRKPVRSGHGDTVKRKLTAAQKRTLKNRGQIDVTITLDGTTYYKTVRRRNIRAGAWEYYRRSQGLLARLCDTPHRRAAVQACGAGARPDVTRTPAPHPPTTHSADQPPNSGRQDAGEGGHGEPENMRIDERR
jgi:hypothetical protein